MGLSFSTIPTASIPASLNNIYIELLDDDVPFNKPKHGDLTGWAQQGVLLLNKCLTVRQGKPNSHNNRGWEEFTNYILQTLLETNKNLVFILWGRNAQTLKDCISSKEHLILTAAHPSPLSAKNGFFGCKHFSKTNTYLETHNKEAIDWNVINC